MTDETKKQAGDPNSPEIGGNLEKTYTEADIQKIRSDILAEAGQYKAQADRAMKSAEAARNRVEEFERQQREAELEAHKDDPAELRRIRAEQARREAEAKLADAESKLSEANERFNKAEREKSELSRDDRVKGIATKANVDPSLLSRLAAHTDGSTEAMEDIASSLPRVAPGKTLRPDSNRSEGGNISFETLRDEFIKDPYAPGVRERYLEAKTRRR